MSREMLPPGGGGGAVAPVPRLSSRIDEVFSYQTQKVVRIRDRRLGFLYWGLVSLVVVYIFVFVLGVEGKHKETEPGFGAALVSVAGKAFGRRTGRPYDASDWSGASAVDRDSVFIATRIVSTRGQAAGECVDFTRECDPACFAQSGEEVEEEAKKREDEREEAKRTGSDDSGDDSVSGDKKNNKAGAPAEFAMEKRCRAKSSVCSECIGGFCKHAYAWCPSLAAGNAQFKSLPPELEDSKPELHSAFGESLRFADEEYLEGLEEIRVRIFAGVSFPFLGVVDDGGGGGAEAPDRAASGAPPRLFSSHAGERSAEIFSPQTHSEEQIHAHKTPVADIPLRDLLLRADGLTLADVQRAGALLAVTLLWDCDAAGDTCAPLVTVHRVDVGDGGRAGGRGRGRGHHEVRALQHAAGTRDVQVQFGLKVMVVSRALGRRLSPVLVTIQVGAALALLRLAAMVTDFCMLYLFSARRSALYRSCKVTETVDFSDLQDRLNLVEEAVVRATAASTRTIGLAQGGRGGAAGRILRNRR